jgi:hypothetical protein
MYPQQLLDPLPISAVFLVVAALLLVVFEAGFRVGRWWQVKTADEKEGPTSMIVGSLLALMAFLLAVTMGMASDRFDTRRGLVLEEANSIGTTYLRAGFLPNPEATKSRDLLRQYVPLRINVPDQQQLAANFARSTEIHDELWAIAEDVGRETPDSEVLGLYIDSLNETIDLHAERATAIVYARVPETVVILLILGAALTMGMVGYSAGLTGRRSFLGAAVLVVVLSAVLTLVVDLDRPRDGFLLVSQQPLIELQDQLGPPSP